MIDPAYLEKLGVYQDADGRYKRNRIRARNFEYDPSDPKAELKGLLIAYDEELRAKAVASGADFYHPKWGWLRWGVKPERDHAENLGAGSQPNPRRRVTLGVAQPGRPDPTPEPVPDPEPEPAPEPETEPARAAKGR